MSRVETEVSPALFWHPFEGSVDKEPLFVQYSNYQAQSASSSDISWYIESPANGVLLDNEVWIEYTLTLNDSKYDDNLGPVGAYTNKDNYNIVYGASANAIPQTLGFRFGNPLQKCCQSISLDINGTVLTYEYSKYHDAFNRLFISNEEAKSSFYVGGGFDDGLHLGNFEGFFDKSSNGNSYAPPLGANQAIETLALHTGRKDFVSGIAATNCYIASQINNSRYVNHGWSDRVNYFEYLWRQGGVTDVASKSVTDDGLNIKNGGVKLNARYGKVLTFVFREKLAVGPFHLYDNRDIKMSIPNIRTFQLTFLMHSNWPQLMFRCASDAAANLDMTDATNPTNFWKVKPVLWMRWYTPPPGYSIPKQISIPCSKILTYTNANVPVIDNSALTCPGPAVTINISNISLPAVPDLFVIYCKRRITDYKNNYPDDYNLAIKSIQIDMEGNSGKLNNCQEIHLWNMYRRHLRLYPCSRDDFDAWYKYHCILPITGTDLGVIKGAGMDNPIQLSISNMQVENWYKFPSIDCYDTNQDQGSDVAPDWNTATIAFDFHLVCIYDKYALTLTSDGSSAYQMLRVNSMGSSTVPAASGGPSSLADISI